MGNLQKHAGPLSQSWLESQFELGKQIVQRMSDIGIIPVLPAFTGFMPRTASKWVKRILIKIYYSAWLLFCLWKEYCRKLLIVRKEKWISFNTFLCLYSTFTNNFIFEDGFHRQNFIIHQIGLVLVAMNLGEFSILKCFP